MAVVLVGLAVLGGRFYLANWHGHMVFLPVVLLLGGKRAEAGFPGNRRWPFDAVPCF